MWPGAEAEAAFLSDAEPQAEPEDAAADSSLPTVAALLGEVPASVRDALEDLFRAKFTRVIRVRKKDLA